MNALTMVDQYYIDYIYRLYYFFNDTKLSN